MAKFVKLGEGARIGGSFSDATTEINLTGGQVQKVRDKQFNMRHIKDRMKSGHIAAATEAEYLEYLAEVQKQTDASNKELAKKKLAAAPVAEEDTEDEDLDDEEILGAGSEDDDDDEDDDDGPDRTRETMIADLQASPLVEDKKKAKLESMSASKLIELHNKIILGK